MDRRKFLKLFGAGAAIASVGLLAGVYGCGKKEEAAEMPEGGPPPGPEPGGLPEVPPVPQNEPAPQ